MIDDPWHAETRIQLESPGRETVTPVAEMSLDEVRNEIEVLIVRRLVSRFSSDDLERYQDLIGRETMLLSLVA